VPGPVVESIAVAPVLLADDERSTALAADKLIATVALPPHVTGALDADSAGLILVATDGEVRHGAASARHESVDPSRKLFDVIASGDAQAADTARAYEFGVLATAAQLVGAGQAMLNMSVEYAKQRSQFGRGDRYVSGDQAQAGRCTHRRQTGAARSALQTHGAIGFTQEHDLSLWPLRVQALRSAWGDPTWHRRRVLEAFP
jgi:hypothetical protein